MDDMSAVIGRLLEEDDDIHPEQPPPASYATATPTTPLEGYAQYTDHTDTLSVHSATSVRSFHSASFSSTSVPTASLTSPLHQFTDEGPLGPSELFYGSHGGDSLGAKEAHGRSGSLLPPPHYSPQPQYSSEPTQLPSPVPPVQGGQRKANAELPSATAGTISNSAEAKAKAGKRRGHRSRRGETPENASDKVMADRFRTKLCNKWVESGVCPYESRCMFAHGDHDLRTTAMNLRDGLVSEEAIRNFKRQMAQRNRHNRSGVAKSASWTPPAPLPTSAPVPGGGGGPTPPTQSVPNTVGGWTVASAIAGPEETTSMPPRRTVQPGLPGSGLSPSAQPFGAAGVATSVSQQPLQYVYLPNTATVAGPVSTEPRNSPPQLQPLVLSSVSPPESIVTPHGGITNTTTTPSSGSSANSKTAYPRW